MTRDGRSRRTRKLGVTSEAPDTEPGAPKSPRPCGWPERILRFGPAHIVIVTLAAAVLVQLVVGVVRMAGADPPIRSRPYLVTLAAAVLVQLVVGVVLVPFSLASPCQDSLP